MPKLFKKFTLSFLAFLVLFFSITPSLAVKAQAATTPTWYDQDFPTWYSKVSDTANSQDIFGERYTSAQVEWVIYGLFAFFINRVTPVGTMGPCMAGQTAQCIAGIKSFFDGLSTSSSTSQTIPRQSLLSQVFSDRPLSGITYTKNRIKSFNLTPVVHAQSVGFGFDALKTIQDMWKATRDVSFGLFVLVAVIFAFMIMFRVKINPQTVITVQSAIPKVVIALIFVTFSYAIAGFLVDFMYVVIGLLSVILSSFSPAFFHPAPGDIFSLLTIGQPFGSLGIHFQAGIFGLLAIYLLLFTLTLIVFFIFKALPLLGPALGGIFAIIAIILIIVSILISIWNGIKTLWSLLKAFVNIILLTAFAPLQITLGVFVPNLGFGQWFKSFISNLAVFVVTGALFYFSLIFLAQGIAIGFSGIPGSTSIVSSILTPILGPINTISVIANNSYSSWPPLLGANNPGWTGLLFLGVSFVLFTLIPKANEFIQSFLSGKPFAYGSAIGEAQQGVNWAATGTSILANKKSTDPRLTAAQQKVWQNVQKASEFIESFTKGHH